MANSNLVLLNPAPISATINFARTDDASVYMVISFVLPSTAYNWPQGPYDDNTQTVLTNGDLGLSSAQARAVINSSNQTTVLVAGNIESKRPGTGGALSLKNLLEGISDVAVKTALTEMLQ